MSTSKDNNNASPNRTTALEELKLTRDFGLYLDMLSLLKKEYLIIFCLKNTSGQNFSEETVEKIRSLGFSDFTAEPDMKYMGVLCNGGILSDIVSGVGEPPLHYKGDILNTKLGISFLEQEAEIEIDGVDRSLNDNGLNIAVYDCERSEIVDVSCYDTSEGNPTFYHRNFYYDDRYINTHIYIPESYKDSVALPLKKSYFSNRRLSVREVERGIFLPIKGIMEVDKYFNELETYKAYGGICDENLNFIAGHQLFNPKSIDTDGRHILDSYEVAPEDIEYIDETVLYGGTLIEHPGHLITECFADRLWWLVQNADSDIKIAFETMWRTPKLIEKNISFVMEFFNAFGISEDRLIVIEKPTQFKKIIVPDQSAIPLNYCFPYEFTSEYIKPFQHITKRLAPGKYKKIYLTKSKLHTGSTVGEKYFIDFFERKGFKIINPEDHTIKEKAELMYGADEVVTIDGTNSLFTVFCKPSVRLTILTRRMDYWDTAQQLINEAVGIKEFFLVNTCGNFLENFSEQPFRNYSGGLAFTYATKEFKEYVRYVYNEELDITPEESLKKYLYDYLAYFPEYYSKSNAAFYCVRSIKMTDILRGMSEVFLGKKLDTADLDFLTEDEIRAQKLKFELQDEKKSSAEKIKLLSDKAKGFVDEIASLRNSLAQLEAENKQLREKNSEMASYMAEISSLLDALEAGTQSEE